jgi:hypothetical protein
MRLIVVLYMRGHIAISFSGFLANGFSDHFAQKSVGKGLKKPQRTKRLPSTVIEGMLKIK